MRALYMIGGGLVVIGLVVMVLRIQSGEPGVETLENVPHVTPPEHVSDKVTPEDLTYRVAGKDVRLQASSSTGGGATETVTGYFGNELTTDLNDDGTDDTVFFITEETGGTGVFYYVVAAVSTPTGYEGTEAVFIGDRIAPQAITNGDNGTIVVTYADRAPGEPFTTPPSMAKSIVLGLDPLGKQLGQVMIDFTGEASPEVMSLTMKTWEWKSVSYTDGRVIAPRVAGDFKLTFLSDGTYSMTTDCNGGGGTYTVSDDIISFGDIQSTLMYCEGSQEQAFHEILRTAARYYFTSRGELIFELTRDGGLVLFN
jgi:heat shock protein HslJ